MAVLHAAFSGGGAVGALISGALLSAGVDFRRVYLCALIPLGMVIFAVAITRFPSVGYPRAEMPERAKVRLYKNLSLLVVALITALVFLSEGAMEDWSGIYLRQTLALPALLGASGVAIFHASMAVGRLGAAGVINRFGNRRTLQMAGLLAAGGMAFALATREPLLVVAGFLVVGLALAVVAPIAFSFAGDIAPDRVGGASSVVTIFGYGGVLLGPAIVGGLAELYGLRTALGTIAVAGLLVFALSLRLKKPTDES
jgi:fucose permease